MKIWGLVLIEITYALLTRVVLRPYFPSEIGRELMTTVFRLATIPVYWVLFRDVIGKIRSDGRAIRQKPFWIGVTLFLLVPVLVPVNPVVLHGAAAAPLFALTSFVVGFREELAYRAVLQNLLDRKWGLGLALVISNVVFVVYHVGSVPLYPVSIVNLFLSGCILGLIYAGSRSLVAASLIHGVYDALAEFSPYMDNPVPGWSFIVLLFGAVAILARWMWTNADLKW